MEYVSLLPPEIKKSRVLQQRYRTVTRILLIAMLIIVVIFAFLMVSSIFVQQDLTALQIEKEDLERRAARLVEYEELYIRLTTRESMVGEAMGTVPPWNDLLLDTSRALQAGTWISDLNLSYAGESGSLTMSGWAYDHSGVAVMLDQLINIEQLNDVKISASTEIDYQGMEAVQFQVSSQILTGPPFVDVDEEDEQDDLDDQNAQNDLDDQNEQDGE